MLRVSPDEVVARIERGELPAKRTAGAFGRLLLRRADVEAKRVDEWLRPVDAARLCGVSLDSIYKAVARGELRTRRLPYTVVYARERAARGAGRAVKRNLLVERAGVEARIKEREARSRDRERRMKLATDLLAADGARQLLSVAREAGVSPSTVWNLRNGRP
jgi:hypothetical protein